ncbi:MAG: hypothetical protein HRU03_04345 [Nanoarchaeales archaeon]|nr:hypothetical protein [Nanoarchaeales archaeon]
MDFSLSENLINQVIKKTNSSITSKEFYFDFNEYNLDICFSKYFDLNRKLFFGLVEKKIVNYFYFDNFPKELFNNFILKYELKNKYFNNFKFDCDNCDNDFIKYKDKFGNDEFEVREKNSYTNSRERLNKFQSNELKNIGDKLINLISNLDTKIRFVFVDSKGENLEESSSERFVCYIYNNPEIFNKIFEFSSNYFELKKIKKYLKLSQQIVLSFAIMKSKKLRNSIYFNVNQFSSKELENCFSDLKLELDTKRNVWGIGIDFTDSNIKYKVYYEKLKISKESITKFILGFEKDGFQMYLSCFSCDELRGVLLDYKYDEDGNMISKRIDISVQSNDNTLSKLKEFENLKNTNLYTISFEFYLNKSFKINTYYSLN